MKLKIWEWVTTSLTQLIGRAITKLTTLDGQEGLAWEDVRTAAELIRHAEYEFATGAERREWVLDQIKNLRRIFAPHLLELVFWTALNYASSQGWIKLSGKTPDLSDIISKVIVKDDE